MEERAGFAGVLHTTLLMSCTSALRVAGRDRLAPTALSRRDYAREPRDSQQRGAHHMQTERRSGRIPLIRNRARELICRLVVGLELSLPAG